MVVMVEEATCKDRVPKEVVAVAIEYSTKDLLS
jgi:hypothetical protein